MKYQVFKHGQKAVVQEFGTMLGACNFARTESETDRVLYYVVKDGEPVVTYSRGAES